MEAVGPKPLLWPCIEGIGTGMNMCIAMSVDKRRHVYEHVYRHACGHAYEPLSWSCTPIRQRSRLAPMYHWLPSRLAYVIVSYHSAIRFATPP